MLPDTSSFRLPPNNLQSFGWVNKPYPKFGYVYRGKNIYFKFSSKRIEKERKIKIESLKQQSETNRKKNS